MMFLMKKDNCKCSNEISFLIAIYSNENVIQYLVAAPIEFSLCFVR